MDPRRIALGLCALAPWVAGCSSWNNAPTTVVDGYTVALRTDPAPLQVGQKAALKVRLTRGDQAVVTGCGVVFRQHMPGMEMYSDQDRMTMTAQGKGIYAGTSAEFSMGGDWQIEVKFSCDGTERTAAFDYRLEWPE